MFRMGSFERRLLRPVSVCIILFLVAGHPSLTVEASPAGPQLKPVAESTVSAGPVVSFVPGEVVLGWAPVDGVIPGASLPRGAMVDRASQAWKSAAQSLSERTGLDVLDIQPGQGRARLAVTPGQEQAEITRLSRLPWVQYAEPNYLAHAALVPDDPLYSQQWDLQRIDASDAWDRTLGDPALVVAVIDSGIDCGHPEFAGRVLAGYNYVNPAAPPDDDYGHGTHVAGILAAALDNGIGVAGLAPNVKILPIKVLDFTGSGSYDNVTTAIYQAVAAGAAVINLSLGGTAASKAFQGAVDYAISHNVVVVAAAGNYIGNIPFYPAGCGGVIAVTATDAQDQWAATYSAYQSYVALAAPGGPTLSTLPLSMSSAGYDYESGTSMAAPLVAGSAALIRSLRPDATPADVLAILEESADKVTAPAGCPYDAHGHSDCLGYGRLDVGAAVRRATLSFILALPLLGR